MFENSIELRDDAFLFGEGWDRDAYVLQNRKMPSISPCFRLERANRMEEVFGWNSLSRIKHLCAISSWDELEIDVFYRIRMVSVNKNGEFSIVRQIIQVTVSCNRFLRLVDNRKFSDQSVFLRLDLSNRVWLSIQAFLDGSWFPPLRQPITKNFFGHFSVFLSKYFDFSGSKPYYELTNVPPLQQEPLGSSSRIARGVIFLCLRIILRSVFEDVEFGLGNVLHSLNRPVFSSF